MSRSRMKTPISGMTYARSEKADKALSHRKIRRAVAVEAWNTEDSLMPIERQLTNPWSMAKDGKFWFSPKCFPRLMRK